VKTDLIRSVRQPCVMKFLLRFLIVLCSISISANAQKFETFAYGDSVRQKLDVYAQKKETKVPVIVFVHGGGWSVGRKSQHQFIGKMFQAQGYVAVVINYRLFPESTFPGFPEDAASAVQWVSENIETHGGDPKRIFLMGHSAGAHSVALLGLDEQYLKAVDVKPEAIRGVVGVSGPMTLKPSKIPMLKRIFGEATDAEIAPVGFVDGEEGSEPPFLLLHGKNDPLVPFNQSKELEKRILEKGGRAKGIYFDRYDHITILGAFSEKYGKTGTVIAPIIQFIEADGDLEKVKTP